LNQFKSFERIIGVVAIKIGTKDGWRSGKSGLELKGSESQTHNLKLGLGQSRVFGPLGELFLLS